MEKYFFKYTLGYINIDEHHLYLTKTGNWSEIYHLKENCRTKTKKHFEKFEISKSYYYFILIISAFLLIITERKNTLVNFLVVGFNVLFIFLKYFNHESIPNFKIPIPKILKYNRIENDIELFFINEINQDDYVLLKNVDLKMIPILDELMKVSKT